MKTIIFTIATMIFGLLSFGKAPNSINNEGTAGNSVAIQTSFSTNEIVSGYLKIKNGRVKLFHWINRGWNYFLAIFSAINSAL